MAHAGQLSDLAPDWFPIRTVEILANFFNGFVSFLCSLLHFVGFPGIDEVRPVEEHALGFFGSGLANLVFLSEQLNLNRAFSVPLDGDGDGDCAVCLCRLRDGDCVRRLGCRHVFHRDCLEGWLHCLKFSCPICRSAFGVPEERASIESRRMGEDLIAWFSVR